MKKRIALLAGLVMLFAASAGGAVFAGSVPETITLRNAALGKNVEFRSFDDFGTVVRMYNSGVGRGGVDGTGCYDEEATNFMTDGKLSYAEGLNAVLGGLDPTVYHMAWAYMDLGEKLPISRVGIYAVSTWVINKPVVQVSEDGTNWTTVFSGAKTPLYDSAGNEIYSEGLVNTDDHTAYLNDLTAHSLGSMSLHNPDADGGYQISFDAVSARYLRFTDLISEHTSGGSCNNTMFAELQVYTIEQGVYAPTASLKSGGYESIDTVSLSTPYADAKIFYTTDDGYPTPASTQYTGPIQAAGLGESFTIRAITQLPDGSLSLPADYRYVIGAVGNVALGKNVEFRSFDDFGVKVDMYDYYVDNLGIDGTGCRPLTGNHMTDGITNWNASNYMNATKGGSLGQPDARNLGDMAWALVDLGKEISIDQVGIYAVSTWAINKPVVQVSADGTTWTTVFSGAKEPLYDSAGNEIYGEGLVNTADYTHYFWDLTGHALGSMSLSKPDADGGYQISFDAVSARYLRFTDLISEHTNVGSSNNTVFAELQVHAIDKTLPELSVAALSADIGTVEGTSLRYQTPLEDVLAKLPATLSVLDTEGQTHSVPAVWSCAGYDGSVGGDYVFRAAMTLPAGIENPYEIQPAVTFTVAGKADFAGLNAAIVSAKAIERGTITQPAWDALQTALSGAETVAGTENALQSEVDAALAALTEAVEGLAYRGDKTALAAELETCAGLTEADYTASSWTSFAQKLAAAQAVNAQTEAGQAEVDAALAALSAERAKLVVRGDGSALSAKIDEIEALGIDLTKYTASTGGTLEEALQYARELLEGTPAEELTETAVGEKLTALNTAYAGLVLLGDKTALTTLIAECEALREESYVTAGWTAFLEALEAAGAAAENPDLDQTGVDGAKAALESARGNLVPRADMTGLKAEIARAEALKANQYTALSFARIAPALSVAKATAADPDTPAAEVKAAEDALKAAVSGLVRLGDKTELRNLITKCEGLKEEDYRPYTFEPFRGKLAEAKTVAEKNEALQPEIDAAKAALESAKSALVARADSEALARRVAELEQTDLSKFSQKSRKHFEETLAYAKAMLADFNADQSEVDEALAKLNEAGESLSNNTLPIVLACVGGGVLLAGAAFTVLVSRRRKANRGK